MFRVPKAKSRRAKRALASREPQVHETLKPLCVLRTPTASMVGRRFLASFAQMSKPDCVQLTRAKSNDIRPFEDVSSLEFLLERNDTPLFALASHSKKRPDNIILGRTFSGRVLDMVEVGITGFAGMDEVAGEKPGLGHKPCIIFEGAGFEATFEMRKLRNLLLDMLRGRVVDKLNLAGLDRVCVVTAPGESPTEVGTVHFRHYYVTLKKSGSRLPRVELTPCGPNFTMTLRRTSFADPQLYKEAIKQPRGAVVKKTKNIERDGLGNKLGRVHMEGQDLMEMATKKFKAFDRRRRAEEGKGKNGGDSGGDSDGDSDGDSEGGDFDGDAFDGDDASDTGDLPDPVDFFREGEDEDEQEAGPKKGRKRARK